MGFLSKLFGSSEKSEKVLDRTEYNGFEIEPNSLKEGGQYRVAGRIYKQVGEDIKEHKFIRSDVLSNKAEADNIMLQKARTFIDQMGDEIF